MSQVITVRQTARLLLVADERLLLLRRRAHGDHAHYWLTPGGGLEPHESYEQAAVRELHEEVGLEGAVGPWVWTSRYLFLTSAGARYYQIDRHYLIELEEPFPLPDSDLLADENIDRAHWWSLTELEQTEEDVFPVGLETLFRDLLAGVPEEPLVVGRGRR